jgi:flagellar M-ring protein FliF
MDWDRFANLFRSLTGLRRRRLIAPAAACAFVFAFISTGGHIAAHSNSDASHLGSIQLDMASTNSAPSKAGIAFETGVDSINFSAPYRDKGPRHEQH